MKQRFTSMLIRCAAALLAVELVGCINMLPSQTTAADPPTPTAAMTPTVPPTTVPGSAADRREVADKVRQFGTAVINGDEVLALLVLSPSAQQIVAASNLSTFVGSMEPPQGLTIDNIRLTGDVAIAECMAHYGNHEQRLHLQLVRLEGVWKIDARINDS